MSYCDSAANAKIMQGDQYGISIVGSGFELSDVAEAEFTIGTLTKYYRADGTGEVTADGSGAEPVFAFPITQAESYGLHGYVAGQVRIKFLGNGHVVGARLSIIHVDDSMTRTVL